MAKKSGKNTGLTSSYIVPKVSFKRDRSFAVSGSLVSQKDLQGESRVNSALVKAGVRSVTIGQSADTPSRKK